jgi:membrane protease YdiL (CAAX protease family)
MSAFGLDQAHIGNVPRLRPDEVLGLALLTSAVLPGVVEELFFRGMLFRWLSRTYPVWLAMLVSSGLFALGHLGGQMLPLQMVSIGLSTFLAGCIYAMAYARTGTLYAAIFAHVLFDIVPTAGLTLGPERGQVVGFAVVVGGYAVAVVWLFVPSMQRWRREHTGGLFSRRTWPARCPKPEVSGPQPRTTTSASARRPTA